MGNEGPLQTVTLSVSGMTCGNCVNHVQKALQGTPGVVKATVNLKEETASVQCAPTVSPTTLTAAVKNVGYDVRSSKIGTTTPGWQFWRH